MPYGTFRIYTEPFYNLERLWELEGLAFLLTVNSSFTAEADQIDFYLITCRTVGRSIVHVDMLL